MFPAHQSAAHFSARGVSSFIILNVLPPKCIIFSLKLFNSYEAPSTSPIPLRPPPRMSKTPATGPTKAPAAATQSRGLSKVADGAGAARESGGVNGGTGRASQLTTSPASVLPGSPGCEAAPGGETSEQ